MSKKLYVGNLSYSATEEEIRQIFAEAGAVDSVNIIRDRQTDRSRGFGFVEMSTDEDAKKAVEQLNGKEIGGRKLNVSEARPQRNRDDRGGSGGGGGHRRNFSNRENRF